MYETSNSNTFKRSEFSAFRLLYGNFVRVKLTLAKYGYKVLKGEELKAFKGQGQVDPNLGEVDKNGKTKTVGIIPTLLADARTRLSDYFRGSSQNDSSNFNGCNQVDCSLTISKKRYFKDYYIIILIYNGIVIQ